MSDSSLRIVLMVTFDCHQCDDPAQDEQLVQQLAGQAETALQGLSPVPALVLGSSARYLSEEALCHRWVPPGGPGARETRHEGDAKMTRKSIERKIDQIIETVCKARNINPAPAVKGGEAEIANASVYSAIKALEGQILTLSGVPASEAA